MNSSRCVRIPAGGAAAEVVATKTQVGANSLLAGRAIHSAG